MGGANCLRYGLHGKETFCSSRFSSSKYLNAITFTSKDYLEIFFDKKSTVCLFQIKISDFGLSRNVDSENYYFQQSDTPVPIAW